MHICSLTRLKINGFNVSKYVYQQHFNNYVYLLTKSIHILLSYPQPKICYFDKFNCIFIKICKIYFLFSQLYSKFNVKIALPHALFNFYVKQYSKKRGRDVLLSLCISFFFICKLCKLSKPYQLYSTSRTVSLLRYDYFTYVLLLRIRMIVFITI